MALFESATGYLLSLQNHSKFSLPPPAPKDLSSRRLNAAARWLPGLVTFLAQSIHSYNGPFFQKVILFTACTHPAPAVLFIYLVGGCINTHSSTVRSTVSLLSLRSLLTTYPLARALEDLSLNIQNNRNNGIIFATDKKK